MRIPDWLLKRLQDWAAGVMERRKPDFLIGPDKADPYMERWWIVPRNRVANIYLHRVRKSDDDRALHDHPWVNASVILETGYVEMLPVEQTPEGRALGPFRHALRPPGAVVARGPRAAHRLVTIADFERRHAPLAEFPARPAVTLFLTGPKLRTWGFWCERWIGGKFFGTPVPRFVPWQKFVNPADPGRPGPGCGD